MSLASRLADLFALRTDPGELVASYLDSPEPWLLDAFGQERTFTGRTLSKRGSEALSTVWACKRVIEEDIGKLPLDAYRRLPNGGREKATDTVQHRIVHVRPNSEQTPSQFKARVIFDVLTFGDFFAEIEREDKSPNGFRSPPVALWPLLPDVTRAKRVNGVKVVETWVPDGSGRKPVVLLPGDYIHVPGPGYDGLKSFSVLAFAKQTIAHGLGMGEWAARFYDGDAQAAAWVSVPNLPTGRAGEDGAARIQKQIREQVGGMTRAHRLGILWGGATLQQSVVTPKEQDLIAAEEWNGYQVARFFRCVPHKVGLMKQATFSNIAEQALEHVGDCLMPRTTTIKEALDWELWPEESRGDYFFDWNYKSLLRGNPQAEAEAIKIGVVTGWISRAEARQLQNMNPAPDDQGLGEFLAQVNQVPSRVLSAMVEQAGSEEGARALYRTVLGLAPEQRVADLPAVIESRPDPPSAEQRAARSAAARNRLRIAHEPLFLRAAERYLGVEAKAALRLLEKAGEDLAEFTRLLAQFYESFPETVRRELAPVMGAFGSVLADAITEEIGVAVAGPAYDAAVVSATDSAVSRHVFKSQNGIAALIAAAASAAVAREQLAERFAAWRDVRPAKVAKSESVRAGGRLAQEAYQAGGVRDKIWVTFADSCPLCAQLSGKVVGIEGTFLAPGDRVDPQTEGVEVLVVDRNIRYAPLHGGCDCGISSA